MISDKYFAELCVNIECALIKPVCIDSKNVPTTNGTARNNLTKTLDFTLLMLQWRSQRTASGITEPFPAEPSEKNISAHLRSPLAQGMFKRFEPWQNYCIKVMNAACKACIYFLISFFIHLFQEINQRKWKECKRIGGYLLNHGSAFYKFLNYIYRLLCFMLNENGL